MNIENIFKNNTHQSIESLEFYFFLKKFYFSLLENNETDNSQIKDFIDLVGNNYYYQSYKIQNYTTSLRDYVFWQSGDIYLKNMNSVYQHPRYLQPLASLKKAQCLFD